MEEAIKKSLLLSESGLVNNKNICIKNFGSTFACVCEKCINETFEDFSYLISK